MNEKEIIDTAISELMENALKIRRENFSDAEKQKRAKQAELRKQAEEILKNFTPKEAALIEDYIDSRVAAEQEEYIFIYIQGAKDCVRLLKNLCVI